MLNITSSINLKCKLSRTWKKNIYLCYSCLYYSIIEEYNGNEQLLPILIMEFFSASTMHGFPGAASCHPNIENCYKYLCKIQIYEKCFKQLLLKINQIASFPFLHGNQKCFLALFFIRWGKIHTLSHTLYLF